MSRNISLFIIELNEFSPVLLETAAETGRFPNIKKVLSFSKSLTVTEDTYDSGYLEPWVQWVSVHTGVPAKEHLIKHLGDVPSHKQIWEQLSERGIRCGFWGTMNGERRDAENCQFFLPDPWTFSEPGYPQAIQDVVEFPRYYSKNYLNPDKSLLFKKGIKLFWQLLFSGALVRSLPQWPFWMKSILRLGFKNYVQFSIFEHLSTLAFLHYYRQYRPQCSAVFLNLIAHIQHYYWTQGAKVLTPQIEFGLDCTERILQDIFKTIGDDQSILVLNALSQKNTNSEEPWVLYVQKRPKNFLQDLGIPTVDVEQLMTNDAHAFFESQEQRDVCFDRMQKIRVNGHPLLYVEKNDQHDRKLFYRLDFFNELPADAQIEFENLKVPFFDHFDRIVVRTGKHTQAGVAYSKGLALPQRLQNHEISHHILRHFQPEAHQ